MRQGYRLTATPDGDEALDAVAQGAVDVALVDLMLPGWSGWDVVEEMRRLSALPIIVISALSSLDRRLQLLGLGADDYLVKPFAPAELMARLATILRRTRSLAADAPIPFGPFVLDRPGRVLHRGDGTGVPHFCERDSGKRRHQAAAPGVPVAQRGSHCPDRWRARSVATAWAPACRHRMPAWAKRCLSTTLQAPSTWPDPMGSPRAR